jgi:hypothetical protein
MHNGKQALTKPQNKVGVPQKKGRTEEGKGGEPAVPSRRTCGELAANLRSAKGWYRQVRLVPDKTRTSRGRYALTKCTKQLLKGSAGVSRPEQVSRRALRALKPRGLSGAGPFLTTCSKPHTLCVSSLSTGSSWTGLAYVQPHSLLVWLSGGHHRRGHGDNRHGGQDRLIVA